MLIAWPGLAFGQFVADKNALEFFSRHSAPSAQALSVNITKIYTRRCFAEIFARVFERPAAGAAKRALSFPLFFFFKQVLVVSVNLAHQKITARGYR